MNVALQFIVTLLTSFTFLERNLLRTRPSLSLSPNYKLFRYVPNTHPYVLNALQTLHRSSIVLFSFPFITFQTLCAKKQGVFPSRFNPFSFHRLTNSLLNDK
jgi:hypothetical protein